MKHKSLPPDDLSSSDGPSSPSDPSSSDGFSSTQAFVHPRNFVVHLQQQSRTRPEDIALIAVAEHEGQLVEKVWNYRQFSACTRALAAALQRRFAPGDRALILLDNDEHYAISLFACFHAGVIAVPVFPPESARSRHLARLQGIAADSSARGLLTSTVFRPLIEQMAMSVAGASILCVDEIDPVLVEEWRPHQPSADDVAFLQYTSGSTSAPKGVMVTHGNLMANERAIREGLSVGAEGDRFGVWAPLFHDMGLIGGLLQPFYSGIPCMLCSPRFFLERPVRWLQMISRHRVTLSGGPDFAFRLCLERIKDRQLEDLDLSSWRVAYTGAEPVRHDTMTAFARRFAPCGFDAKAIYPCYGLAEATLFVTGGRRDAGMTAQCFDADALARRRIKLAADTAIDTTVDVSSSDAVVAVVGTEATDMTPAEAADMVPGDAVAARTVVASAPSGTWLVGCGNTPSAHQVRIVDPGTCMTLPPGTVGEIWAAGPSIAAGYWGNAEATAQAFVQQDGERWLRTGDLGAWHDDVLYVVGRLKDMIIVRGHNIYPHDIERAIEADVEAVRRGRVTAFPVELDGREGIGVAAEISRGLQKLVPPQTLVDALMAAAGEASGETPMVIVLLNPGGLPRTTSGKLQRSACRQGWAGGTLDAYAVFEQGRFMDSVVSEAPTMTCDEVGKQDAIDEQLMAFWREALGHDETRTYAPDAHFLAVGGNSLAATQLAAEISQRWGLAFTIRQVLEHPHLYEQASFIRASRGAAAAQENRAEAQETGAAAWAAGATAYAANESTGQVAKIPVLSTDRRSRPLPTSFAQQRQWFLWQLDPGSTAYHVQGALRLQGPLDVDALQQAIAALGQRHESLRTVFRVGPNGEVQQLIQPEGVLTLQVADAVPTVQSDVSSRPREKHSQEPRTGASAGHSLLDHLDAESRATLQAVIDTPFDLTHGPLARALLLCVAADEHVLVLVMHHIISDAASMQVLISDLGMLHAAGVRAHHHGPWSGADRDAGSNVFSGVKRDTGGRKDHDDIMNPQDAWRPPAHQYVDYVAWLASRQDDAADERLRAYWRAQLATADGVQPVLALTTDHPRASVARYRAAHHQLSLSPDVLVRLDAGCQRQGVTRFMVLLTAFQLLLYRYTGQPDIRVGVPVANRPLPALQAIVGLFVNTLVLRNRLEGRMTLQRALMQTREAALQAHQHQDLPFDRLVEMLQPVRDLAHTPLVQVIFNHLRQDFSPLAAALRCTVSEILLPQRHAQFELAVDVVEHDAAGPLEVRFTYARELFEAQTIEQLADHYLRLVQALVDTPEQHIDQVDLLSEVERACLKQWGEKTISHAKTLPVHRLFEQQARKTPAATALVFGEQTLSYGELDARANRLAHRLIAEGVKPETKVGIAVERSIDMVVGLLAILKAGAAYVPLDPAYPAERLAYMIKDSGIGLLLAQEGSKNRIPAAGHSRLLALEALQREPAQAVAGEDGTGYANWHSEAEQNPDVAVHGENLAYVIYTSGSTGKPKGVGVAHHPFSMHCQETTVLYEMGPHSRELHFLSFAFDGAHERLFTALTCGASLVLRGRELWTPAQTLDVMKCHKVTNAGFPVAYLQEVARAAADEGAASTVRLYSFGGEAMPRHGLEWIRRNLSPELLINGYGPTEAVVTPVVWKQRSERAEFQAAYVPIGRPMGGRKAYVLDEGLNLVPAGVAGELYLGGECLARGYLGKAALTAERFVADPFGQGDDGSESRGGGRNAGGRLYRTGDLVRWNAEGQLEYLGRIDHQVKIRGFRIELGEVEAQLLAQPEVREAVAVACEGPTGARLVGYVSAKAEHEIDTAALKERLGQVLPEYMVPSVLMVLEALPLNANGKVDRKALPQPEATASQRYEPPQGEVEEKLAAIWAEVLGVSRVGMTDSFFDLGGNSLALVRLRSLLETRMGLHLQMVDLFQHPTIRALATWMRQSRQGELPLERGIEQSPAAMSLPTRAPRVVQKRRAALSKRRSLLEGKR